jgi:porin
VRPAGTPLDKGVADTFAQSRRCTAAAINESHRDVPVQEATVRVMHRRRRNLGLAPLWCWLAVLAVYLSGGCAARAAEPVPERVDSPRDAPWLLGDWNGRRIRLQDHGVDLQLGYTGEFAFNATGGVRQEAAYADQYVAGATFDLGRLAGLDGTTVQVTLTARTGRNLSDDVALGTLQQVQEVYGRGQTLRLTQLWINQRLFCGRLEWKLGRLTFGEEFASFPCEFENLTFCGAAPGNLVSGYLYNWPVSQWATRLRYNIEGFGYLQAGVYDVNPQYASSNDTRLPVFFAGSTGVLFPVELAWLPRFHGVLPGSYKLGAWYDTSAANDVVSDINGNPYVLTGLPPRRQQGRSGAYLSIVQQLTPLAAFQTRAGLSAFLNAVVASDRTSPADSQVAAGLVYTGLFRSRPDDDLGFAVGMTRVNSRIAATQVLVNSLGLGPVAVQGAEFPVELHYTFRPVNGFLVRPSIQYVINPGGTGANPNALVLGFTTSINF